VGSGVKDGSGDAVAVAVAGIDGVGDGDTATDVAISMAIVGSTVGSGGAVASGVPVTPNTRV
jgi:hypothetical protein